jgi:hypothetical protein
MMNFCKSIGLQFGCDSMIRARMFDRRASNRRYLFMRCCGMLSTKFRCVMKKFCCSLSTRSDFGTTPLVRDMHFFLDFIFH